ncbi:ATP-binding protein [Modestobacter sp. VKM Ac-2985]|uniref:ATP-binding protein n=1 Tax=Modestobacter sp. VKM Ac-2985 TaxID=3004139 RepID=UPI0022AB6559|nr:ATP-binding protein [Modestobacter sp. VKM Ac-2985]MCZ2835949.1 ATP-binding protein [Modestobacter sp. VKM Ac-2985]
MRNLLRRSLRRPGAFAQKADAALYEAILLASAQAAPTSETPSREPSRDPLYGWEGPSRLGDLVFPPPAWSSDTAPVNNQAKQGAPNPPDTEPVLAQLVAGLPPYLRLDTRTPEQPELAHHLDDSLRRIAQEYTSGMLAKRSISPTRTLLLTGPPGTGKTMTARWIAREIRQPLLVLDLAAVMSSELGRSGQNLAAALEAAANLPVVLFIDEFDAIAAERAMPNEMGELRRLVNVLLLALDRWPAGHLLIAATNHPDLLDRASYRRFEEALNLTTPDKSLRQRILGRYLPSLGAADLALIATITDGANGANLENLSLRAARRAALADRETSLEDLVAAVGSQPEPISKSTRDLLVDALRERGWSARHIGRALNLSHVTIGKRFRDQDLKDL